MASIIQIGHVDSCCAGLLSDCIHSPAWHCVCLNIAHQVTGRGAHGSHAHALRHDIPARLHYAFGPNNFLPLSAPVHMYNIIMNLLQIVTMATSCLGDLWGTDFLTCPSPTVSPMFSKHEYTQHHLYWNHVMTVFVLNSSVSCALLLVSASLHWYLRVSRHQLQAYLGTANACSLTVGCMEVKYLWFDLQRSILRQWY